MNPALWELIKSAGFGFAGDQLMKRTGLGERAESILDKIIPPAAASGADAIDTSRQDQLDALIAQENMMRDSSPAQPVLPATSRAPVVQQAYPQQLPDIQMGNTPEEVADQTRDFVREFSNPIMKNAQRMLASEVPREVAQDPEMQKAAVALSGTQALAANADMIEEPMDLGAPVQFGPTDVAQGMYPNGKPAGDKSGFFDKAGNFFSELFGDEERMTRLALAFNSMRFEPDQGLASVLGKRLETLQSSKRDSKTAIVVAQRLQQMGYPQYAKIVMERPDMAPEILKQIMQKEFKPDAAIKTSGVQTDPVTGQKYLVKTDPNTGDVERIDIPNAIGLTPQAEADLEAATASNTLDQKTAIEYGQKIFDQAQSINSQVGQLEEINRAIDAGAVTGPVSQFLPTITKATAQLEAAANSLGINVINSATFGALSEAELRLALSTGLPQGLPEDELRLWVKDKIAAQKKMRDELFRQAQTLMSGGVRYTEWASNFAKKSLEKSAQESAPAQAPIARPAAPAVQSSDDGFTVKEIR